MRLSGGYMAQEDGNGITFPEDPKFGHLVLRAVNFLQAQGLKPGDQFPLSRFIDTLADLSASSTHELLMTPLVLDGDLESEALSLLNERLDRERQRRGGVGLAQLATMINTAINDAAK